MKKRIGSIAALVLCGILLLSSCAPSAPASSSAAEQAAPAASGAEPATAAAEPSAAESAEPAASGFPLSEEKVTLTAYGSMATPAFRFDYDTNMFTTFYEELTNVHIDLELTIADTTIQQQKFNLKLASGDYPDIFLRTPMTRSQLAFYGSQNVFIPLNDLIAQHGPAVTQMISEVEGLDMSLTAPDGNIYGLPYVNLAYHMMYTDKMWLNYTWLNQLNLEVPTTTEEFQAVLKAFKEQDPNGNGEADEIPLASQGDFTFQGLFPFLMNSFIPLSNNGRNFCYMDGDTIVFAANKEEFRDGLRYIAALFKDGLIAPNSFTLDRTQRTAIGMNEPAILGAAPSNFAGGFVKSSEAEVAGSRFWDFQAIAPLKGPGGVQATQLSQYDFPGNAFSITSNCQYPEIAMRWVDWLYSAEGTMTASYGPKWDAKAEAEAAGYGFRYAEEGEEGSDGNPAIWLDYGFNGDSNSASFNQLYPYYQSTKMHTGKVTANPDLNYERNLWEVTDTMMVPYAENRNVPPLFFSEEVSSILAEQEVIISDAVKEAMARFVTGNQDIETEWDAYVQNLEALGLNEYLASFQQEYDNNRK